MVMIFTSIKHGEFHRSFWEEYPTYSMAVLKDFLKGRRILYLKITFLAFFKFFF